MNGEQRRRDSPLARTVTAGGSKGAGREEDTGEQGAGEPVDRGPGGSSEGERDLGLETGELS